MKKINEYMTIQEAADFLGMSVPALRNWEKAGKIKVTRNPFNNRRIYRKEELEAILNEIGKV